MNEILRTALSVAIGVIVAQSIIDAYGYFKVKSTMNELVETIKEIIDEDKDKR